MKKINAVFIAVLAMVVCAGTLKAMSVKNVGELKSERVVGVYKPDKIQTLVDEMAKQYHTGVVVLSRVEGNTRVFKAGYSNESGEVLLKGTELFEIGSASKVFTGIAIMQLVEQGKMSLNDPLSKYYSSGEIVKLADYKGKNYWNKVTVKMLLNHTSGIVDYLNRAGDEKTVIAKFNDPNKKYSFDDLVHLTASYGDANFVPGTKFAYSNTGYVILGDLIKKVSHKPWRTYIKKHIFKVAGLTNTFFGSQMKAKNKINMATGYLGKEVTHMPYTLANSAGEIVSNAHDLSKFLDCWVDGKFYKDANVVEIQRDTDLHELYSGFNFFKYGLACIVVNQDNVHTIGHLGETFGFQSYISVDVKTKNQMIILMNNAAASPVFLIMALLKYS